MSKTILNIIPGTWYNCRVDKHADCKGEHERYGKPFRCPCLCHSTTAAR